jgi:hypothetical protein
VERRRGIWRRTSEADHRQTLALLYGGFALLGLAGLVRSMVAWRLSSEDIIAAGLLLSCGPLCVRAVRRWRRELARLRPGLTPAAGESHLGQRQERHRMDGPE